VVFVAVAAFLLASSPSFHSHPILFASVPNCAANLQTPLALLFVLQIFYFVCELMNEPVKHDITHEQTRRIRTECLEANMRMAVILPPIVF
jgi:hypothetical protein